MILRACLLITVTFLLSTCAGMQRPNSLLIPLGEIEGLAGSRPDGSASETSLFVANFAEVVFGGERGDARAVVFRWPGDIRLRLVGRNDAPVRDVVAGVSRQLSLLTGRRIARTAGPAHDFALYVLPRSDFAAVFAAEFEVNRPRLPRGRCFGYVRVDRARGVIVAGAAFIDAELDPLTIAACVTEELAQGLGLPNDTFLVMESVFNDHNDLDRLSYHDAILIRTLYDPHIGAGMTRAQVMPIAARIIHRLSNELRQR